MQLKRTSSWKHGESRELSHDDHGDATWLEGSLHQISCDAGEDVDKAYLTVEFWTGMMCDELISWKGRCDREGESMCQRITLTTTGYDDNEDTDTDDTLDTDEGSSDNADYNMEVTGDSSDEESTTMGDSLVHEENKMATRIKDRLLDNEELATNGAVSIARTMFQRCSRLLDRPRRGKRSPRIVDCCFINTRKSKEDQLVKCLRDRVADFVTITSVSAKKLDVSKDAKKESFIRSLLPAKKPKVQAMTHRCHGHRPQNTRLVRRIVKVQPSKSQTEPSYEVEQWSNSHLGTTSRDPCLHPRDYCCTGLLQATPVHSNPAKSGDTMKPKKVSFSIPDDVTRTYETQ